MRHDFLGPWRCRAGLLTYSQPLFAMLCLLGIVGWMAEVAQASVRTWSVPEGEAVSEEWNVAIDGQPVDVYTARTADPPFDKDFDHGGSYGFVSFDRDAEVVVTIRSASDRLRAAVEKSELRIRPESLGVEPKLLADGAIELRIPAPMDAESQCIQISVEPQNRRHPLLIFANPPETNIPDPNDPKVHWFGPGIHRPDGGKIELKDGETLYLEAGAVVQAGVVASGANIRIAGRGILCGNSWEWRKGPTAHQISINQAQHVQVDGIVVRGASHWTIVPVNCDDVSVHNVKLCGGRVQNDDGINPCNSRHVTISDCFLRTDDDCVAIKGLNRDWGNCEDITVERCTLWCDRARITLLGHESRADYMRRIIFRNCDVLHFQMPVFLLEPGEEMRLEEFLAENIRIEADPSEQHRWFAIARPTVNMYMQNQVPGHVRDITFRDITVTGVPSSCGMFFEGMDEQHRATDIVCENITIFGKQIQPGELNPESTLIRNGNLSQNVSVEWKTPDVEGFRTIFDGQTLRGWHGDPGYQAVPEQNGEPGKILLTKGTHGHFYTDAIYGNCVFKLEYRVMPGGNSGVALRSPSTQEEQPAYVAMEVQVLDDDAEKHATIETWQHNGSLYGIQPAKTGFHHPAGQWNEYEITVDRYHLSVKLNGYLITEADLDAMGFVRLLDQPGETLRRLLGHLGFTGHGDENIEYRNLRVKILP
ncbi:MAG: DUF1080 domain-containing protein [Thermoguttaceae bacterium]|nr:DUF1080 domain-containing protein [Thermoguttaceae bacterium]